MQTKVVPTYNNNVVCVEGNPALTRPIIYLTSNKILLRSICLSNLKYFPLNFLV